MAKTTAVRNREAAAEVETDLLGAFVRELKPIEMPDIVTFAEHPSYLGKRLYPRQRSLLRLIFLETEHMTEYDVEVISEWAQRFNLGQDRIGVSPDVWKRVKWLKENGYPHFREIANISGRRGSKGLLGAILGARQIYRLIQLGNPQEYYGIERGKEMYCYVTATGRAQAIAYQFADLANAVLDAPCFQPWIGSTKTSFMTFRTPADKRRITEFMARGIPMDREMASIYAIAASANSSASRGGAAFMNIFDEMAHMLLGTDGPRTADSVYNALMPSLDQLGVDAMAYIPTSPLTKVGKAFAVYNDGITGDENGDPSYPTILTVQLPSWEIYEDWDDPVACGGVAFRTCPQRYDENMRQLEKRDPITFRVERKAQWAEVIDAFLEPEMVDRIFEPFWDNEQQKMRTLSPKDSGALKWVYRGHGDPSKSEANFAVAFGHCEPIQSAPDPETGETETWMHVLIDWMHVWKPSDFPDHQVDYIAIEKEIARRIVKFPTMETFSYDQYGSFVTVPQLREALRKANSRTRVKEVTFSGTENKKRNEIFRAALGMGWVHSYKDEFADGDMFDEEQCLLELELKFLQEKNGVVDRQKIGPVTTKDLADTVMVIAQAFLGEQYEKLLARQRLSETDLVVGAQGGYHSGQDPGSTNQLTTRERLNALSNSRSRGFGVPR